MTKLTKGIAKLKNEIEKQARELNQRYPNPTHDSSFVSDPLWKKQQGDMERLEQYLNRREIRLSIMRHYESQHETELTQTEIDLVDNDPQLKG